MTWWCRTQRQQGSGFSGGDTKKKTGDRAEDVKTETEWTRLEMSTSEKQLRLRSLETTLERRV